MRWLLAFVIALHGLIHFMGPAKAFGYAPLPELRITLSPAAGAAWLVAALLFLLAALLHAVGPRFPATEWWWVSAIPALVLSQVLIIQAWPAAKFGTLANIIILAPAVIAAAGAMPFGYRATYAREVARELRTSDLELPGTVTDSDLAPLPPVVQRYLRLMEVIGRPRVKNFRVQFSGTMRNGQSSAWMPMVADQHSFIEPNSRLFIMRATQYGLPFEALHLYRGPAASFEVSVASLIRVVDARGPEMDQSETVTMLNDLCLLAPAALIQAPVVWSEATDQSVRAVFINAGHTVSAQLLFAPDGALVNFVSDDRYQADGKTVERARWSTPVSTYGVVDGIRLPVVAEAHWTTAAGEFAYARFQIQRFSYNVDVER